MDTLAGIWGRVEIASDEVQELAYAMDALGLTKEPATVDSILKQFGELEIQG